MSEPNLQNNTMFPSRPLVFFLVVLVAFLIVQTLVLELPIMTQVAIIASQLVVILGGALLYRSKFAEAETRWPTLRRLGMSPLALVAVLATSVCLGFLANALGALTVQLFPGLEPMAEAYQSEIETLLLPESATAQVLGAVAVAGVAPVVEEFLFRGTILPSQRREQIAFSAIALNGILFSLMHLNPVSFVALALVGAYFAHVTVRSDALWGAITGHAVLNLVNGVVLIRVVEDIAGPDEIAFGDIWIALAILVPATALLWWLSIYLIGPAEPRAESTPPGEPSADGTGPGRDRPQDRTPLRERPDAGEETDTGEN